MKSLCHTGHPPGAPARPRLGFFLVTLAVLLAGFFPASGASGPLRLSGGFMQFWPEMQSWPPENWQAVLQSMKQAQMNTVIVQMLAFENNDGSLYSFIGPNGQPDATETILDYADTNGFKIFLGLYMPNWNHDMTGSNFLFETQTRMAAVAQQAWDRYLSHNRHSSFAGWFIPYEPWTGNYQPAEVDRLRSFFQSIDASCQAVSGDFPLLISPFINSYRPSPCRVEQLYRQILNQSGIDIVLLQDSVGAQRWETNIEQRVAPYFEAFQNACESTGAKLWANLESFRISNVYAPCDATRLKKQFDAVGPFVENFVTFDFLHYMNPAVFLPGWDATRRGQMQQLYSDYKSAFVDVDYTPFARPAVSATVSANELRLTWHSMPGDQFEVQVKTNLSGGSWMPSATPILVNGAEFTLVEPLQGDAPARWYRVQKLARLTIPETMVYIPPGTFRMGTPATDPNKTAFELSPFQVTLTRGFWLGQFEVTQSEYQNLLCTNPASNTADLECPVDKVSWANAMEYCSRLTQQERQALRLPEDYVYRLPTEAEWEYAARAATTNWFSFGDDPQLLPTYAWYNANSQGATRPVGQLQPNPWGIRDIHGNVFEWCWDWIGSAPAQPVTDLRGATNGTHHAIRGGASSYPWVNCRSSWRIGYSAASVAFNVGFRIVLAPADP
ncbi:MAG TPA: DUF4434 domain-containing protein [Clostridia bacterium]|nr:DUF4434 domain-containing protein [Clostridia bacterium]